MDGSGSNGNCSNSPAPAPAPFLVKTYEMVDDPLTNSVVSWSLSGLSFVVWNPPEFATDLLPNYFKHNNFSSFIRQLNTYGFSKVDPDQWEFANEEFIRGQRYLLKNIQRRKPIHSHSISSLVLERQEYVKMIENLKQEKYSLQSEVERHKHENREYENQLRSLGETLQNIDQRQQQLMVSLARLLLQKPAAAVQPRLSQNNKRQRRLLALQYLQDHEANLILPNHFLNIDLVEKQLGYSSLTFDQIPADHHHPNLNNNNNISASGPHDSPPISSICIDLVESVDKASGEVDHHVINTTISHVDGHGGAVSSPSPAAAGAGANDVFWQQFLTEPAAPDSSSLTQSDTTTTDLTNHDHHGLTNYQQNKQQPKPW